MGFALTLPFKNNDAIPKKFTCDGANVSPALAWSDPPSGTKSLALIVDDPDAPGGTFVHWVLFGVPSKVRGLSEGLQKDRQLLKDIRQGQNDFGKASYGGPCPPRGAPHRYFFKLYALDDELDLKAGASKGELERVMKGHVLAHAEIVGSYGR